MGTGFTVTTGPTLFAMAVILLSGSQSAAAFPDTGAVPADSLSRLYIELSGPLLYPNLENEVKFGAGEIPDGANCTFRTHQLDNLLALMMTASQGLSDLKPEIQILSGSSPPSDRCERYLWEIEMALAKNVREVILIKANGTSSITTAEKLNALTKEYARIDSKMKKLISQHGQKLSTIREKYNQQLHTLEGRVAKHLQELDAQAQMLYDGTVEYVVLNLKHMSVEDAASEMNYFSINKPSIAGDMVKRVVKQMWTSDMRYFSKTMSFIQRLPATIRLDGYSQQVDNMKPFTSRNASSLLNLAYKVRSESTGGHAALGSSILGQFPATINQLMGHTSCLIKNVERGHYMKVVSSDNNYYMVGETSSQGGTNRWTLVPFQDSVDSPVHFRIVNTGSGKYISDDQGDFGLTSSSASSKWEIKFEGNRVLSQSARSPGYLFSPSSSRYLYEAQRSWEPWRCGVNQFLDCAVLTSEDKMYDEGKWIFECSLEKSYDNFRKFHANKY